MAQFLSSFFTCAPTVGTRSGVGCVAVLCAATLTPQAQAQTTRTWTGGGATDSYNTTANWTVSVPNTTSENALFNTPGVFDVFFAGNSSTTVSDLSLSAGTISFSSSNAAPTFYRAADDVRITGVGTRLTLNDAVGSGGIRLTVDDALLINSGGSLFVESGSDVIANRLTLGTNAGGSELTVDGVGSTLTVNSGTAGLGSGGGTGTLTFQNGATGSLRNVNLVGSSAVANSAGRLFLFSGSNVTTDSIVVGNSASSDVVQRAFLNIVSNSTLTMRGSSALTVGDETNSELDASLFIQFDSRLSTGTGNVNIRNGATVGVYTNSVFDVNGALTVDDGTLEVSSAGGLDIAPNGMVVGRNNARFNFRSRYNLNNGQSWTLSSGAEYVGDGEFYDLTVGNTSTGTLVVEGLTTKLDLSAGANLHIGHDGGTGTVTFRDSARAMMDQLTVGNHQVANTTGVLNIESGAAVEVDALRVASLAGSTTSGTINIDDANGNATTSLKILGDGGIFGGTAVVGDSLASDGPGIINVTGGRARLESGVGDFKIRRTGQVNIDGAIFEANGLVEVDGGELNQVNSGFFAYQEGASLVARNNGQINFGDGHTINKGANVSILSGADFAVGGNLAIGLGADDAGGSLVVNGGTSTLDVDGLLTLGSSGTQVELDVRNFGSVTVGHVSALLSEPGGNAVINVRTGGDIDSADLNINANGGIGSSAIVNISDIGSTWDAAALQLGNVAGNGTAELNVRDGGSLTTSAQASIYDSGVLNIDGGSVAFASHTSLSGGTINFSRGSLTSGSDWQIGLGRLLGSVVDLQPGMHLATNTIGGDIDLQNNGVLILNGGSVDIARFRSTGGELQFNRGTLRLRGFHAFDLSDSSVFGRAFTLGANQRIELSNRALMAADSVLTLDHGTLVTTSLLENNGLIRGEGTIDGDLRNITGELRANFGERLHITGNNGDNTGRLNLQGGTIEFDNALANTGSGNIVGRGTLIVGGAGLDNRNVIALSNGQTDIFGDVDNNGSGRVIISGGADVTFWDDVTHSGALFNVAFGASATFFGNAGFSITGGGTVNFEADITPGNSPGLASFGGDVNFGVLSNLEIEIAGLTKGDDYDSVDTSGNASVNGGLTVTFLDGFTPSAGDEFELVTAGDGVNGAFLSESLPTLDDPSLQWQIDYRSDTILLSVIAPTLLGDLNGDGSLTNADIDAFVQALTDPNAYASAYPTLDADQLGDFTGDGQLTNSDVAGFLAAVESLGSSAPAIPEPASLSLLALGGLLTMRRRSRA